MLSNSLYSGVETKLQSLFGKKAPADSGYCTFHHDKAPNPRRRTPSPYTACKCLCATEYTTSAGVLSSSAAHALHTILSDASRQSGFALWRTFAGSARHPCSEGHVGFDLGPHAGVRQPHAGIQEYSPNRSVD